MKKHILLIFSVLLLSSCSSMLYTSIDVLKPAAVSFDPSAQNILLLNNSVIQPDYYGHKDELYNQSTKYVKVNTDSLPLFTLSMLYEKLSESGFFNKVDLEINSVNNDSNFFEIKYPHPDSIKSLCKRYDADVILSLDRLRVNDFTGEMRYPDEYYVALVARYEAQWSILYPATNTKSRYTCHDTIYWEAASADRREAHLALPDRADALIDGALYAGEMTVKRLMPFWEKSDRYFFNSSKKEMKHGMDSIYTKNWSAAIDIWEKEYTNAKNSYKGQLANNLAVAYEFNGNIEKALNYAQQAYNYLKEAPALKFEHLVTVSNYLSQLTDRKADMEQISRQLGE